MITLTLARWKYKKKLKLLKLKFKFARIILDKKLICLHVMNTLKLKNEFHSWYFQWCHWTRNAWTFQLSLYFSIVYWRKVYGRINRRLYHKKHHFCVAETGSARGMATAALGLQNSLGLICDPKSNRVEATCLGRNVMVASNAVSSANMALPNYAHLIPIEEVIP